MKLLAIFTFILLSFILRAEEKTYIINKSIDAIYRNKSGNIVYNPSIKLKASSNENKTIVKTIPNHKAPYGYIAIKLLTFIKGEPLEKHSKILYVSKKWLNLGGRLLDMKIFTKANKLLDNITKGNFPCNIKDKENLTTEEKKSKNISINNNKFPLHTEEAKAYLHTDICDKMVKAKVYNSKTNCCNTELLSSYKKSTNEIIKTFDKTNPWATDEYTKTNGVERLKFIHNRTGKILERIKSLDHNCNSSSSKTSYINQAHCIAPNLNPKIIACIIERETNVSNYSFTTLNYTYCNKGISNKESIPFTFSKDGRFAYPSKEAWPRSTAHGLGQQVFSSFNSFRKANIMPLITINDRNYRANYSKDNYNLHKEMQKNPDMQIEVMLRHINYLLKAYKGNVIKAVAEYDKDNQSKYIQKFKECYKKDYIKDTSKQYRRTISQTSNW